MPLFAILGLFSTFQHHFQLPAHATKISYYEIIMKYHPEIMYAKYHFVRHVGWHLKIKICIQKWAKIDQKVQNVLYLCSSGCCLGNACRINEVLLLVFNRGDI